MILDTVLFFYRHSVNFTLALPQMGEGMYVPLLLTQGGHLAVFCLESVALKCSAHGLCVLRAV